MTKHWFIAQLIDKYTKGKSMGLDIGVGSDNWSSFKHSNFIGLDKRRKFKPEVEVDLENSLPFKDNLFDVCIAINSLNYIENSRGLLNEVNRVMKMGATLVCIVDNEKSTSHPYIWEQKYLDRVMYVTGFRTILNIREKFYAKWFNRTSVYAFAVVKKSVTKKESPNKVCKKCSGKLDTSWDEDEFGNTFHIKCPHIEPIKYAKSYNIETTHPDY